mgnify:CR=1 FL=1
MAGSDSAATEGAETERAVAAVWRIESARIIATLTRFTGDFGLAEDLAQDALLEALAQWPRDGVPANPAAWLTAVAKRRAIDGWRRRERYDDRLAVIAHDLEREQDAALDAPPWDPDAIDDDVLRLVFIACHPALSREARVALTLRVVGGLSTEQIARAFLLPTATVQQRIVRAKKTLSVARAPFEVPGRDEFPARLGAVLGVLYLVFNEAHAATAGEDLLRPDLGREAIRLARVLTALMPAEPDGVVPGADSGCVLASAAATSARTPEACALGDACTERALSSMAVTSSRCSRAQSSKQARRSLLAMPVHCCQAAAFSTRWATSACLGAVCALAVPASSARARAEG